MPTAKIAINPTEYGSTDSREIFDLGNFSRNVIDAFTEEVGPQETEKIELASETSYLLVGDIGEGWSIETPLEVEVKETEDGTLLMSDNEFGFYGEGENFEEIKSDYLTALKTHYKIYKDHLDNNEDPDTLKQFRYMQSFINAPDTL